MMEIGREIEDKREWIGGLGDGKGKMEKGMEGGRLQIEDGEREV